ncbi:Protein tantalus [Papilio xuthus]|uniref:Protein tantalus n=1 Tax=Papilio xuthus TaxID=66420 RepID=A0A194PF53_PAPXU|nr:Protein tantalus [Papilio xuthus]
MDSELPNKMAHLDIMEIDESVAEEANNEENVSATTSRVLRKRKSLAIEPPKLSNRRVSIRPRKRNIKEDANQKEIEALYLNKKVKTLSQTLETIYEEPKVSASGSETNIHGRKVKRLLTFQLGSHYTKEKIKRRRAKIKKLLGNKTFLNRKKIPMQVFLKTIECLDLDEVVHSESKTIEDGPNS